MVKLPDNSEVILNAKSILSYDENNWENNRNLNLDGEAFFKVEKGNKFTVNTDIGEVSVLGTQFNINTKASIFDVICYEGKVSVKTKNQQRILTQGQAFKALENGNFEDFFIKNSVPSWTENETSFYNSPLKKVIKSLEDQYQISIDDSAVDTSQRITGSFINNDLEIALQTVFVPLKINPTFKDSKTVVLVKL